MWRDRVERVLAIVAVALPLGTVASLPSLPSVRPAPVLFSGGSIHPLSERRFERLPLPLRGEAQQLPQFTNVQVVDVDGDGRDEVLACDGLGHRVVRIDHDAGGSPVETTLAADVRVPAHATVVDLDGDGDRDLVLSVLGDLHPSDKAVGRVEWLEHTDSGYVRHVILDDVRRVADVQPGDFDADGDVDLAPPVGDNLEDFDAFPQPYHGCLWLENQGGWRFVEHRIATLGGTYAAAVAIGDIDHDGQADIVAGSQNMRRPYDRIGGVTAWLGREAKR